MLQVFADRLAVRPGRRHLFLLAATIATILFTGYHFGTFDQTIHIPFLKKFANPALFPNDPFLDLRFQHYSYFWFLFVPFYRLGVLEVTLFAVHVLVVYGTFWALWGLSEALFHSSLASLLTVLGFMFPHIGFAGFPVIEFSLLNRTFVLPFLLLAIILFLRRRYWLAFGVVGLMYNLHVISAQFVLAMFLFDGLLEFKRIGWRNLALGLVVFLVTAAPVLIWKLQASPVDFSLRPDWFQIIARGTLYNLFYLFPPYTYILLTTVSGLSALALFLIARRNSPSSPLDRTVTIFIAAAVIILAIQVVTAEWLPITIIIQSQIIRVGLFVLIFGYVYFANFLAQAYQAHLDPGDLGPLAGAYLLSVLPLAPLAVWLVQLVVRARAWRRWLGWAIMATFLVSSFVIGFVYNVWSPGLHIFGPQTAWEDAQVWARDNTPLNAVFITPPQIWWLYQSDWRVFSERSTVVTLSELLEAAFAPDYLAYWTPRFEAVAPGALAQFRGDLFENQRITAQAYYSLTAADFMRLGQRFGAQYLVVDSAHPYALPLVYENQSYRIYSLRTVGAP